MNGKPIISIVAINLILALGITGNTGCANMIPPTGGPKDTLPPQLVKASPPDSSRNFSAKTITFTFDEYIDQLQGLRENLLVSPTPEIEPVIESKLHTITVRIKDTLEPNTTYHIDFGNAVKDVNEGNILKNFSYLFTTGTVLDSLELSGRVVLAETGKTDTTLVVLLHQSGDDSALLKINPRYVARLDGQGRFHFRHMPPGVFYIYALKDEGNTMRYFEKSKLFAFGEKPVEVKPLADTITLYAFAEKKEPMPASNPGLTLNRAAGNRPGGNQADDKRLKFGTSLSNKQQDLLGNFIFTFEHPLLSFDTSKIQIYTDSAYNSVSNYQWEPDSTQKKFTLRNKWKEGTLYHIILDREFAEDTLGRKLLKTDTLHFTTKGANEYGTVKLRFKQFDPSKKQVLQFVQNDQVMRSFPLVSADFYQALFIPGDYELRILFDENNNGIWDPGDFFEKHRQPEKVRPIDRRLTVKPDWENEMEIDL